MYKILINTGQMYKEKDLKSITKMRYFFRKGYMQLRLDQKKQARAELIEALNITGRSYFSQLLNHGILDITIYKYNLVTSIFAKYGITDVWETKEI